MLTDRPSDVVVVGAGIVGAACAYYAARAGLSVTLIERSTVGSGTTSRGEGNILVSDKAPGPELDLALWSVRLWQEIGADLGVDRIELEDKGGLVVATDALESLHRFAAAQEAAGVTAVRVPSDGLRDLEPHLADDLPGGVHYPQDMQVQPVLAAAALVHAAREHTTRVVYDADVSGIERDASGAVTAVRAAPPLSHPRRRQRDRYLGRRGVEEVRRAGARPAKEGVRARHRAAASCRAAQGLLRGLCRQRCELRS
jgi:glycine/D-amino acid oxidase-like deaminating enzyme